MRLARIIVSSSLACVNTAHAIAEDYSLWLGREAKDIASARAQFNAVCVEKNLQFFVEKSKTKKTASERANSACKCVGRFMAAKQDLEYFQTINAFLNGRLSKNGAPPDELNMYLDGYASVLDECAQNPNFRWEPSKPSDFDPADAYNPDGTLKSAGPRPKTSDKKNGGFIESDARGNSYGSTDEK